MDLQIDQRMALRGLGIFKPLGHFIPFPLLDHALAAFKDSFHFLWCQRAFSAWLRVNATGARY